MTPIDTTDHDDWLREIRTRLIATCEERTTQLLDLTNRTPEPADVSTHAALLMATRHSLGDATDALRRIDEGTYGLCLSCGQPVPAERLAIVPQARCCMPCQGRI